MAEMMAFGEPEFFSTSQIRDYCGNARRILRPMHTELIVASEELGASLKYVRSADPKLMGADSRVRAALVSRHLRNAADALLVAQTSMVKTYMSFRKHYVVELDRAGHKDKGREFKFDA
ncbi:hypothetical protein KCV87_09980 [Actinosynnema pretiosum subsp. pretiosum]|uniref:Uncharacterized protein n=1 Tax=Actinosynnema pretiosum subsp. pretiosum TaxID=103721 RepID=A0AA45R5Z6_9PSEU|nr:hypothetical protein APASM_2040 [Actinosynnema pretiosum subsp. pretiosum]QUF06349.1 hypothetical protein KCV87_09980 [Actinosynnema pretiosum subsp. pretiosum]